jgi:uncharacterized membrane protein
MFFIAIIFALLAFAFAAQEGRQSFAQLAIVLSVVALIACVVYSVRALGTS